MITTDRGAIAETVVDGETGSVLPDPEPRELADRILDLLSDPSGGGAWRGRAGTAPRALHTGGRGPAAGRVAERRR